MKEIYNADQVDELILNLVTVANRVGTEEQTEHTLEAAVKGLVMAVGHLNERIKRLEASQ